jgi:hypothetical protein
MPELAVRAYRIKKEAISVINLPENSAFKISDDITVYLIGPREAFGSVDRNALSATVDFNRITIEDEGYSGSASVELGNEYDGIYVLNKEYTVYFTVSIIKN